MAKGYGRELFIVPQDYHTLSNSLLHAWSQLFPSHAGEHDPITLRELVCNTLGDAKYLDRVWYTDMSTEKPTSYTLRATLCRLAIQCGKEMSAWLESMRHVGQFGQFGDEGFLIGFSIATKLAVHVIDSCGARTVRPPVEFGADYLPQGGVWLAWERDIFCCSTISAACEGVRTTCTHLSRVLRLTHLPWCSCAVHAGDVDEVHMPRLAYLKNNISSPTTPRELLLQVPRSHSFPPPCRAQLSPLPCAAQRARHHFLRACAARSERRPRLVLP